MESLLSSAVLTAYITQEKCFSESGQLNGLPETCELLPS